MKVEHHEFAEMTQYMNNLREELRKVYSENTWLRRQVENLREELRSGDGPSPARVSKEMKTLSSENKELRKEVEKLREELRLAKADAGAGPTVGPQVTYSTVRPQVTYSTVRPQVTYSQQPHRSTTTRPRCFGDAAQYNDSTSSWSPCPSCAHRLNCANEVQRVQGRCQNYQQPR